MTRRSTVVLAGGSALVLGLAVPAGAGSSATPPSVVNREVVQAELHSDGTLDVARLFSQLSVVGNGTVHVADPVSGKGLRNLDGFGAPTVKDGNAIYTIKVAGSTTRRTVSDFTKALPIDVEAAYTLNGKPVKAKDIVGKTGDVTATYRISNVSGTPTQISWKDGKGVSHTDTVDLVTPYVGQVRTTLPSGYTDLVSPKASMAADGRGGTILSYSMVLFEPIGEVTQTFVWTGHVKNGVVPAVSIEVVPVSPTAKPELNTGVVGYRDGAAQASELTAGAGEIDANLLKLQGGAGQLLSGLTKLAAGAAQLRDGLQDKIAPGASSLASGAKDAKAGTTKLSTGLGDLSAGADELSDGLGDAKAGSSALSSGLTAADDGASALADGIAEILAGVHGLPAALQADPDYQQLVGALASVQSAITTKLVPGIDALRTGVGTAKAGLQQIKDGVATGGTQISALLTTLGQTIATEVGPLDATVAGNLAGQVSTLGTALTTQSTALVQGLDAVMAGLGATTDMSALTVQGGLNLVKLGLDNPACSLADPANVANPCGIKQIQGLVSAGIGLLVQTISDELTDVLSQASDGADSLAEGMDQLAAGGAALDSGVGLLADGGTLLADGAAEAADGAGQLDDGLGEISDGASQLSGGLDEAASGSGDLADGLDQAAAGDKQVVSGAERLRAEGTSKLVEGGNDTAGENAKKYATLVALADKVADGALPYGAPSGSTGSAAYQLTLAAATTASHDNATRGIAALVLLGAACAVSWFLGRRATAR
jgi:putative membrane protein